MRIALKVVSSALVVCALALLSGSADSRPRGIVATSTAFVPGQTILNVGNYDSDGGEYPFINMFKGGIGWPSTSSSFAYPAVLDANNYPVTASLGATIGFSVPIPDFYCDPATVWVIEWTGTQGDATTPGLQFSASSGFTVTAGGSFVKGATSSNLNLFGTDGSVEFTFNAHHPGGIVGVSFMVGANFPGTLNNLALYRKAQQADYRAGTIFNSDYIAVLKGAKPRALRMLNWNLANGGNNLANAAQMTPTTALTYGFYWQPSIWAGAASGTNTYTATLAGLSSIVDGTTIQVLMTNANTGASTLNVNSLGAISIGDMNGSAISSAGTIAANGLWTFIYDVGLNLWLGQSGGLHTGVPVSLFPVLANQVGVDLWVNYPPHATNAFADFITTTVRDGLNNTGWFEYANECWNFGAGFQQTPWANNRANALGFGMNYASWCGFRARQTLGNVASIYGANSRFKRVLAFQAFGDSVATEKYRFLGFDLNGTLHPAYAAAGYPNYDTAPNRPVDVADIFAYATYYSGAQIKNGSGNYANSMTTGGPGSAIGAVNFTSQPAATSTLVFNGTTVTFVASGATGNQVNIGGSLTITLSNLLTFLQGSADANIAMFGYGVSGNTLALVAVSPGSGGNSLTVTSSGTVNATITAMSGGTSTGAGTAISGLLGAADAYAAGGSTNIANALAWVDWDFRQGNRNGIASTQTLLSLASTAFIGVGTLGIYPAWNTYAVTYSKQVANYEGAMESTFPVAAQCTSLGISTSYCDAGGKINTLLVAYKNNALFQTLVTDQLNQFMASSKSLYGSWYEVADIDQWSLYPGTIYGTPFQSYNALGAYRFP